MDLGTLLWLSPYLWAVKCKEEKKTQKRTKPKQTQNKKKKKKAREIDKKIIEKNKIIGQGQQFRGTPVQISPNKGSTRGSCSNNIFGLFARTNN